VNWGGNPNKSVDEESPPRLHPRKSFSLWKEVVQERSVAWTEAEIESAMELRSTMMGLFPRLE
jgi:light-regulated signal transduction histidine kinase (bacteriophytochrome)